MGNVVARGSTREQRKAADIEAMLKRRLNRDIKEKQIYLHKTSVLCWIASGNHFNRILNDMTLMGICLKLLPSKNAYPKGDTDVKYYNMITDWFASVFELMSNKLYCDVKKLPKKLSLILQLKTKKILSRSDYALLFATMLRSIGIQCRLVVNFAVPSLRPPQKDLFVVSTKSKDAGDSKSITGSKTKATSLAKKIKVNSMYLFDENID